MATDSVSKTRSGIVAATLTLLAFTAAGTAGVAWLAASTQARIAANERTYLLRNLNALVGPERYDNDFFTDTIQVVDAALLGSTAPVTVYRARLGGVPVAALIRCVARGYSGAIHLLVAINTDGTLAGVRVASHRETPGLGDGIERERSDWIDAFSGRSLSAPDAAGWAVRKDGGVFDQFTGATITARAVVDAVHNALLYFQANRQSLFQTPSVPADAPES